MTHIRVVVHFDGGVRHIHSVAVRECHESIHN